MTREDLLRKIYKAEQAYHEKGYDGKKVKGLHHRHKNAKYIQTLKRELANYDRTHRAQDEQSADEPVEVSAAEDRELRREEFFRKYRDEPLWSPDGGTPLSR